MRNILKKGRLIKTKTTELYRIAETTGTEIICFDLPQTHSVSVITESGKCFIGIDPFQIETNAEEKVHLAHELGHCETGSFYSLDSPLEIRQKNENRADRWAINRLVPADELNFIIQTVSQPWELAEYFDVTEEFILKAIEYYRIINKIKNPA